MDREGRARDGLGRPARDLRGAAHVMREAEWRRLHFLLRGLQPTPDQLWRLAHLCWEAGRFGRDAAHYQAWSQHVWALLDEIQTTPALALSDVERNELIKQLWIAWEETGVLLMRMHRAELSILLTRMHHEEPGILPTGVHPARPSISLTGMQREEPGNVPTGGRRSLASQAEVLHQPSRRFMRDDQEPGGGFSVAG
jgi:hypothetical protein